MPPLAVLDEDARDVFEERGIAQLAYLSGRTRSLVSRPVKHTLVLEIDQVHRRTRRPSGIGWSLGRDVFSFLFVFFFVAQPIQVEPSRAESHCELILTIISCWVGYFQVCPVVAWTSSSSQAFTIIATSCQLRVRLVDREPDPLEIVGEARAVSV